MILDIGQGYCIDTSVDDDDIRWAQLWAPKAVLNPRYGSMNPKKSILDVRGPDAINLCLDEFREIMGMSEDEINDWQRKGV